MTSDNRQQDGTDSTRRRFLATAVATGVTGIAGCLGGDSESDSVVTTGDGDRTMATENGDAGSDNGTTAGDGGGSGGNLLDDTYTAGCWGNPADASFNPYLPRQGGIAGGFNPEQFMWLPFARFSPPNDEWRSVLLEDWTIEAESATFDIHPDIVWHNGDPVTAQDVVTKFQLENYVGNPLWDTLSSIEASGEKTVEFSLQGPTNQAIVEGALLPVVLNTPQSIFGDRLEAIQNASDESAREEEVTALQEMSIDKAIGNGPYQLESRNQQQYLLSYFEDYPIDINIPNVVMKFLTSNQARWQEFRANNLDFFGAAVPPEVWSSYPDHKIFAKQVSGDFPGILVNHSDDVLGDIRVRKAIMYVVNRETAANNFRPGGTPTGALPASPTGLFKEGGPYPSQVNNLLGNTVDQFEQYELDTDRATNLLNEAGYSKSGGTWKDSNGNPIELPVKSVSGFSDMLSMARGVVNNLKSFGLDAQLVTTESTALTSDIQTGNFRIAMDGAGSGSAALVPYANYQALLTSTRTKEGLQYPTADATVPPMGEPDGSREPANISEKMAALSEATEQDEVRSATQDLAWVVNQTLPILPLIQDWGGYTGSSDQWNVDTDSPDWQTGLSHWALAKGKIQAKTE